MQSRSFPLGLILLQPPICLIRAVIIDFHSLIGRHEPNQDVFLGKEAANKHGGCENMLKPSKLFFFAVVLFPSILCYVSFISMPYN